MSEALMEKPKERRLRRLDPVDIFDEIQDDLARLWGSPWHFLARFPSTMLRSAADWVPRADVFEKGGTLIVKLDLPGMKKEDIQLILDEGDLIVSGEATSRSEVKKEDCYRLERSTGQFYRRLPLPFKPSINKIEADFKDGVLEVRIPRPATEKKPEPQKVAVK